MLHKVMHLQKHLPSLRLTPTSITCHLRGLYSSHRHQSSAAVQDVAILGGGITGLASAYYLVKKIPTAKVTIYEESTRLGGWIDTRKVEVKNGTILFERGPRTLRTQSLNGKLMVALLDDLSMGDEVLVQKVSSTAARNRYVYYPDHLVRMPAVGDSWWSILQRIVTEPFYSRSVLDFLRLRDTGSQSHLEDESIRSLASRRFGRGAADNAVSAFIHGIYAGDTERLSARAILPLLWYYEKQPGGLWKALLDKFLRKRHLSQQKVVDIPLRQELNARPLKDKLLESKVKDSSLLSFKGGLGSFVKRLQEEVESSTNVTLRVGSQVKLLERCMASSAIDVSTTCQGIEQKTTHSHIINTLGAQRTSSICRHSSKSGSLIPSLSQIRSVTVMVVNLYYSDPKLLSYAGFGYLLPRSVPLSQNPERALGVIFDSCAIQGQDTAPGTKFTVILGGHWWSSWPQLPDEKQGIMYARSILSRHLGITQTPEVTSANLQADCIPQYEVGYHDLLKKAHSQIRDAFDGRLRVAGSSFNGVGVNDCIRAARDAVDALHDSPAEGTGLSHLLNPEWVDVGRRSI